MFNISLFLKKISNVVLAEEGTNEKIIEIIEKHTQIKISPKNLEIKNGIAFLSVSPAVKNKIFINKNSILSDISTNFTNSAGLAGTKILDIR